MNFSKPVKIQQKTNQIWGQSIEDRTVIARGLLDLVARVAHLLRSTLALQHAVRVVDSVPGVVHVLRQREQRPPKGVSPKRDTTAKLIRP